MRFCDLVKGLRWPDVKASLLWSYADAAESLDGYQLAWAKLRTLVPVQSNMRIMVKETVHEGLDDKPVVEVVGRNGELNRDQSDFQSFSNSVDSEYANAETEFSLSFRPWEQWLEMRIDDDTMSEFTPAQVVAHCLWNMTFHGFEEWQIQEEWDEIKRRADEIDAITEEEMKEKLTSIEDIMKELE